MEFQRWRDDVNAPRPAWYAPDEREALGKERTVAFVIGCLALGLALAVVFLDVLDPPHCARGSISAYFYAPVAGRFFVMSLAFVGAFLLAWRGETPHDSRLASLAGAAALAVAFFPTQGTACDGLADYRLALTAKMADGRVMPSFEDGGIGYLGVESIRILPRAEWVGWVHWGSAALLLIVLLYFSAVVFTRVRDGIDETRGRPSGVKRARNLVYYATSLGMVAGFVLIVFDDWAGMRGLSRPVFWGEALALASFGVAWMVKGRLFLWRLRP